MEVLFCFLNWAASFSVVDEESGSKMDIHNLATVIAPNILFSNQKVNTGDNSMEESFLAIEAVHSLIECNEEMCEVRLVFPVPSYLCITNMHLPPGPRRRPIHPERLATLLRQRRVDNKGDTQALRRHSSNSLESRRRHRHSDQFRFLSRLSQRCKYTQHDHHNHKSSASQRVCRILGHAVFHHNSANRQCDGAASLEPSDREQ